MTKIYKIDGNSSAISMPSTDAGDLLSHGYTSLTVLAGPCSDVLFAFNRETKLLDAYRITSNAPFLAPIFTGNSDIDRYPWDSIKSFVLGNECYIMAYEKHRGHFYFYKVKSDYTLSKPYNFMNQRSWPTQNFSEVQPIVITGLMYIVGYDDEHGTVAIFSLDVVSTSPPDTPPLNMLNVWYHQWAKGWENFSFFQLGQSNFFFKINKMKLNVNIDHILDSPAEGSVEIGSWLQAQMPNALQVTHACILPWQHGEPYLATYDGQSHAVNLYHIHADCQGWTNLHTEQVAESSQMISYRVDNQTFMLLYA